MSKKEIVIEKKALFNSRYSQHLTAAVENNLPSMTVPGQSSTISEMIQKFRVGVPSSQRKVVYGSQIGFEKEPFPSFVGDLSEIDSARERVNVMRKRAEKESAEQESYAQMLKERESKIVENEKLDV